MIKKCVLKKVSRFYQLDKQQHNVLDQLEITIDLNEITVILGKSGCGKTTLLRLIAGLEKPDSGQITFIDDNGKNYQPKIGIVFQEPRLMPWLDTAHNIVVHQKAPDWALADELIERMGLTGFAHVYPDALSGGMKSRAAIARALAYRPEVLLMDEPFAALDYFTRIAMEDEIIRIHQEEQIGVIFVTHDVTEALLIGQKLIMMQKGEQPNYLTLNQDYPRDIDATEMIALKKKILADLKK